MSPASTPGEGQEQSVNDRGDRGSACRDATDGEKLTAHVAEFVDCYKHDRPHRSLGLQASIHKPQASHGGITVRSVLGGLHHVYERAA